jgi:hypothetical protein
MAEDSGDVSVDGVVGVVENGTLVDAGRGASARATPCHRVPSWAHRSGHDGPEHHTTTRVPVSRQGQRRPAKRSFSGTSAPVVSWTRTKVSMPINSPNLSLPILRKKMFSL